MKDKILSKMLLLALCGISMVWGGCSTENPFEEFGNVDDIPGNIGGDMQIGSDTSGDDLEDFTIVIDDSDDGNYTEIEEVIPSDESDEEYNDFIENSTFTTVVKVNYNGTSVSTEELADGVVVRQNGAHVTVTSTAKKIEYILTGTTTDGSFKIYSDNKFRLTLDGVSITNSQGAAINIQSKKRAFLVCAAGTSNVLTDGSTYTTTESEDEKACLFSEGQMIFSGAGELLVTGNYKHGICSDQYVRFRKDSKVTVKAAVKDGIHTNDYIIVGGGMIQVTAVSDGMECEEGHIALRAGQVTIHSGDDAIAASYKGTDTSVTPYIGMYGGLVKLTTAGDKGMGLKASGNITLSGGVLQVQVDGEASKGISCDGDMQIVGGKLVAVTTGDTLYEDNDLSSAAGIKCDGALTIGNAAVALKSSGAAGKGISCGGDINIKSGVIKVITTGMQSVYDRLDSSAKGIKSKSNVTIDGGLVMVRTSGGEGSEGIESKNILTVNEGEVEVSAYDDCLNASNHLAINGGQVYCYSSGNDGMDSNGTLAITGGTIVASGALAPEEGIDCDQHTFTITGGTVIGIGGTSSTPTASQCTQPSFIYAGSAAARTYFCITDGSGKSILAYKVPRTYNQLTLLVTSPELKQGSSYTLLSGITVSDLVGFHGLLVAPAYSGGSQAGSFTLSSMVTTLGNTGGGPGGNNRPGGWGW